VAVADHGKDHLTIVAQDGVGAFAGADEVLAEPPMTMLLSPP